MAEWKICANPICDLVDYKWLSENDNCPECGHRARNIRPPQLSDVIDPEDLVDVFNILGVETLDVRNSDSLDFQEIYVEALDEALVAVFRLGIQYTIEDKAL